MTSKLWLWFKVVFVNAILIFAIIGALMLIPPAYRAGKQAQQLFTGYFSPKPGRADLTNYKNIDWARQHFKEIRIQQNYHDYIVWRRVDVSGQTVNIKNGLRVTTRPTNPVDNRQAWFFGGSAMWGTGSNDENTIPSIFSVSTGIAAVNYGESGYIARQSLAMLANEYTKKQYLEPENKAAKKLVVFYDGFNDVSDSCVTRKNGLSTRYQRVIRNRIGEFTGSYNEWHIKRTFLQLKEFFGLEYTSEKTPAPAITNIDYAKVGYYLCDDSPQRAHEVARMLVSVWLQAQDLAHAKGDEFVAVLQPGLSVGSAVRSHLQGRWLGGELKRQHQAVYPLIRKYAKQANLNFIDMTDAYDVNQPVYIDVCHVSPNGNRIFVKSFIKRLKEQNLL